MTAKRHRMYEHAVAVRQCSLTYHSLQHRIALRVVGVVVHHTGAVDQEDPLEQRDVLPHLGLARNRRSLADLLTTQRVDDGALAHVGVSNEANTDLLLLSMQHLKLKRSEKKWKLEHMYKVSLLHVTTRLPDTLHYDCEDVANLQASARAYNANDCYPPSIHTCRSS